MRSAEILLDNELGLHARPASMLVKAAGNFECNINIINNGKKCNAKSIMSLLSLGIKSGETICIETDGQDEEKALEELIKLIVAKFGE